MTRKARHTVNMMLQNHIGALSLGEDKFALEFQITTKDRNRKIGGFRSNPLLGRILSDIGLIQKSK